MSQHFLKLRANITLPGDVALAERDLKNRYERLYPLEDEHAFSAETGIDAARLASHSRPHAFAGFVGVGPKQSLLQLSRELSCIQEIWVPREEVALSSAPFWTEVDGTRTYACVLPFMAASELWGLSKSHSSSVPGLEQLAQEMALGCAPEKLPARVSSSPHLHGLHKYKARFFPRLARMLLQGANGPVLDPFVGSGTTLVEAALLGIPSMGVDIDPLSCRITEAKLELLQMDPARLEQGIQAMGEPRGGHYELPPWMARKFVRKGLESDQALYESTIAAWVSAMQRIEDPAVRKVVSVCLSDGISRKFNVRMMGTGVGRFALEVRKTSLDLLIRRSIEEALKQATRFQHLRNAYALHPASAEVVRGNAGSMPLPADSQGFILTSPPYLPAASGREAYLFSKSIALTALGLMNVEEIEQGRPSVMGSMQADAEVFHALPQGVTELVDWLANDELRSIKAQPTLAYYQDLQRSLIESYRVLRPGGIACWVIGKESVFYTFKTRKVLRRVPCDLLFMQIADYAGFEVVETLDIELQKRNLNARPRSKDPYFETAVLLKKRD
ncbi:MAG: DNA methyltransferase [Myxococcota bacterium]|nr:DNA methyltransferase [Myxococcota bacterium]